MDRASASAARRTSPSSRVTYERGGLLALEGWAEPALDALADAIERERGLVLLSAASKRARVDVAWLGLRSASKFVALTRRDPSLHQKGCAS